MKNIKNKLPITLSLAVLLIATACKHEPPQIDDTPKKIAASGYPEEIGKIMVTRCATAGCHNATSYKAAGGLRLDEWQYLFDGSTNGAVIVPYNTGNSSLLFFINPHDSLGLKVEPPMPYNGTLLTREEYYLFKNWIANGAPDKDNNIAFSSNPNQRQKLYLTQQGCDLMAVIDAEKSVVMRYINIGRSPNPENPHYVKFDSDGVYAYVCYTSGEYLQKIDTRIDTVVAEAYVGPGSWNVLYLSPDNKTLVVSDLTGGKVVFVDAETMTAGTTIPGFKQPHGITANKTADTFIVTGQQGNFVYKFNKLGVKKQISIDENVASDQFRKDPHEIMMSPDFSKYFLTCERSHEVRVMDAYADTLIKVIPVGSVPKEMAISKTKPYLLVTCMEDVSNTSPLFKGSVYVLNYNTLEIVQRIDGPFYQPHGIAVNDRDGTFYVASTNTNPNGPAPHHPSDCGSRNGYYQVYDLNTLKPKINYRFEVAPDPYSMDVRFK